MTKPGANRGTDRETGRGADRGAPENWPPAATPVAVVDIGSNSVRLVVFDGAKRAPAPLFNEKVLCGLGRSVASTGKMSKDAVERALSALTRYRALADILDVTRIDAVATAAAREARNGPDFIARAEDILGTPIAVLSGRQEAELAANGVIAGFPDADGLAGDLGGGSLELINIKKQELSGGVTLPLGGLKLIDMSGGDLARAGRIVDRELEAVDWLHKGKDRPFYAVGGTWRAFARLHMEQTRYPFDVMHGYRIALDDALKFTHLLDHLSPASMEGIDQISRARREVVGFGALVLERLLKLARPSEVIISATGVREGFLYSLLEEEEKKRDPLLAACLELARLTPRKTDWAGLYPQELCAWTDRLMAAVELKETRAQRRLRHAACLISDVHWRAHPEYRGEQSMNLVAHGSFYGIDHKGRAFLALSSYFRHEGLSDSLSPWLMQLVDKEHLRRARIVGAAIRTVHMISATMPGILPRTEISVSGGKRLILRLPPDLGALDGERLRKRLAKLAALFGLSGEVKVGARKKKSEKPATA